MPLWGLQSNGEEKHQIHDDKLCQHAMKEKKTKGFLLGYQEQLL